MHTCNKGSRYRAQRDSIVNKIINHPVFYKNSHNPQLPVPVQLTIFLNSVSHYRNAATTEDIVDWAGVSVGMVYNCHCHVMVAILQHHDDRVKDWVEEQTCPEWRGGFLSVDSTPFNLFQKPGWHGKGFYDRKSNYSLSAQVVIMPHNLRIVNYVIGVPGSVHDSNVCAKARIAHHPQTFFGGNELIWADSAYGACPWYVVPFKRPAAVHLNISPGKQGSGVIERRTGKMRQP
ncbi:hypothetical protein P692DRAFT_201841042 [Suillus brevipes Sb2]|nr:hypothetical protein P692DRAFT_201841042 [Suillus brevipes Sb2]